MEIISQDKNLAQSIKHILFNFYVKFSRSKFKYKYFGKTKVFGIWKSVQMLKRIYRLHTSGNRAVFKEKLNYISLIKTLLEVEQKKVLFHFPCAFFFINIPKAITKSFIRDRF